MTTETRPRLVGAFTLVGLTGVVLAWRWLRPSYALYVAALMLVPLMTGSLLSMPRFVVVIFPAFWVLARAAERRRLPTTAIVATFAAGYALLGAFYVNWWDVF